jgi:hypothetical protein
MLTYAPEQQSFAGKNNTVICPSPAYRSCRLAPKQRNQFASSVATNWIRRMDLARDIVMTVFTSLKRYVVLLCIRRFSLLHGFFQGMAGEGPKPERLPGLQVCLQGTSSCAVMPSVPLTCMVFFNSVFQISLLSPDGPRLKTKKVHPKARKSSIMGP